MVYQMPSQKKDFGFNPPQADKNRGGPLLREPPDPVGSKTFRLDGIAAVLNPQRNA